MSPRSRRTAAVRRFRGRAGLMLASVLMLSALGAPAALAAPPSNDTFAGATIVAVLPFSDTTDTTEATVDDTDAEAGKQWCDLAGATASVWYALTPTQSGAFEVDPSASDYSVKGAVVSGAPDSLQVHACFGPHASHVFLEAGTTYRMMLADGSGGNGGTLRLTISPPPPPPNVGITVDSVATVDGRTGVATVTGTVTCSAKATAYLGTSLTQPVGRMFTVSAFGGSALTCNGTSRPWSSTMKPFSGKFAGGHATATATAFACNLSGCAQDAVERAVKLRR